MAEFGGGDPLANLIQAIMRGKTEAAIRLARCGMPVNVALTHTVHGSPWRSTPLISAVTARNMEVFEALLEAGASPNTALPDGMTALELAVMRGHEGMVRTLIDHGAEIEPRMFHC